MAYDNYSHNQGYHGGYGGRANEPLPPVPQATPSPFDEPHNPYFHDEPSQPSYNSLRDQSRSRSDPWTDEDAVPMSNFRPKHASQTSMAPIITPNYDDPFVRDKKRSHKRRSREMQMESGWFKGKITWVCFTLSVIQIAVFIAQISRNGKEK